MENVGVKLNEEEFANLKAFEEVRKNKHEIERAAQRGMNPLSQQQGIRKKCECHELSHKDRLIKDDSRSAAAHNNVNN